jgi:hypothetical protein
VLIKLTLLMLKAFSLRMSPAALLLVTMLGVTAVGVAQQSRPGEVDSTSVVVESASVPLNSQDASQTAVGDFHYAGGVAISARETDQLHGLSDLEVAGDRLIAVGDLGILLEARLIFDADERLAGLADVRLTRLRDEDGTLPSDKTDVDAEGLALMPGGDRLVSFERRHRILSYPATGGAPRRVPAPEESFPANGGMEALAADPEAGENAYLVGAEVSGSTWSCRAAAACTQGPHVKKPEEFGLVAMRRLPRGQSAYLLRAYDEVRGVRVSLQIVDAGNIVAHMDLTAPLTVDNFEGLGAAQRPDGGFRFYLISDDNASPSQRTLLLAFDWRPR